MRPYGERKKIRTNIKDAHPQKGYIMWWQIKWKDINKSRERQRTKNKIRNELMWRRETTEDSDIQF